MDFAWIHSCNQHVSSTGGLLIKIIGHVSWFKLFLNLWTPLMHLQCHVLSELKSIVVYIKVSSKNMFNFVFIPLQVCWESIGINLSFSLFVHMPCMRNFSLRGEPVLMKLYTVAISNLRICMKEANPGLNMELREKISSAWPRVSFKNLTEDLVTFGCFLWSISQFA